MALTRENEGAQSFTAQLRDPGIVVGDLISPYAHGGARFTHPGALDFSANINPLGMPKAAADVLRSCADLCEAYPDQGCGALTAALSGTLGQAPERIVCTAGATDLIDRIVRVVAPKRGVVMAPCYADYERALVRAHAAVTRVPLDESHGFAFDDTAEAGVIAAIDDGADLVFLASPNNPTGICVPPAALRRIVAHAREARAVVAVDECFRGFTEAPSATALVDEFPNLVVIDAATKLYALPGLRLGWGIAAPELARRLRNAGLPWAVSAPAQVAGAAALGDDAYRARTRELVASERTRLARELSARGLRVIDGAANYLLFQGPRGLYGALLARDIVIRRCSNFSGLDGTWYRVAVRTPDENGRLLEALDEVIAW
jgi:threonine-phosphate decarboxylase